MKKGCFVKLVIIVTILIGAAVYIVENKFDEFIFKPAKKIIISEINDEWNNNLKFIKNSAEKDSLKTLFLEYMNNIKSVNDFSKKNNEKVLDILKQTFKDSIIDKNELKQFQKLINTAIKND